MISNKFLVLISIFILFSCSKPVKDEKITLEGAVFGTTYKIVYLNTSINYQKSIDSLFLLMNTSLSTYIPSSDISRINSGDTTVVVDDLFLEVFKKSKRIHKETKGYFDPTVGNLVNAWGFGPKNEKRNLTATEIQELMQFVGLDLVKIVDRQVFKKEAKIYLDFNSIAKGFGIDVVARFLTSKKITNYLIEIGGEIRAKGTKNNNIPWLIKIVDPTNEGLLQKYKSINLSNRSMATSGNYRKYRFTENGQKFVHTINPITGQALESNLLSASVIANLDCADVDAYATAFMAMGLKKSKKFLQEHPLIDGVLLFIDDDGRLKEYSTINN